MSGEASVTEELELQLFFPEKRKLRRVLTLCIHTWWKGTVCPKWFSLLNELLSKVLAKKKVYYKFANHYFKKFNGKIHPITTEMKYTKEN